MNVKIIAACVVCDTISVAQEYCPVCGDLRLVPLGLEGFRYRVRQIVYARDRGLCQVCARLEPDNEFGIPIMAKNTPGLHVHHVYGRSTTWDDAREMPEAQFLICQIHHNMAPPIKLLAYGTPMEMLEEKAWQRQVLNAAVHDPLDGKPAPRLIVHGR